MMKKEGSFTVEAALIFPVVLAFFALTMRLGIALYQEVRETATAVMEEKEPNTVKLFYTWNVLGEWIGDGD